MPTLPKYESYKDSGVEWLAEIPEHWKVLKIRRITADHRQGFYSSDNYVDEGIKLLRITDLKSFGKIDTKSCPRVSDSKQLIPFFLKKDDFLFARTGGAGTFGLVEELDEPLVYASYLIRFRFIEEVNPTFLKFYFLSDSFQASLSQQIHGGVNQNVHAEDIKEQLVSLPPVEEQKRIVEFLDRKTSEIDQAIAQKQRLIELLQEQKAILINQAVTKGLDSNVSMCDSGIEWIGKIPKHWKLKRVKNVSSFVTSGPRGWAEYYADEGSFFLQSGNLNNSMGIELEKANKVQPPNGAEGRRTRLRNNDVLVCITGANTGRVAIAKLDEEEVYINQHLCLIRPTQDIYSDFLSFCLHSAVGQTHFFLSQYGLKEGLGLEDVKNAVILEPPLDEQKEITKFLSEFIEELDRVEAKTLNQIARLSEMKSIFIAEAVTGKIRV